MNGADHRREVAADNKQFCPAAALHAGGGAAMASPLMMGEKDMAWATPLSEYGRIRRIALRRPADSFIDQSRLDAEWRG